MYEHQFHQAFKEADTLIRYWSKFWAQQSKQFSSQEHPQEFQQYLVDAFHMLRIATVLMHPIAPKGTEKIRSYLNVDQRFWSWDFIFETIYTFMDDPHTHQPKELPPRTDFFRSKEYDR